MGTRSKWLSKQNTWTLLPELPASKITAYLKSRAELGEILRFSGTTSSRVGIRNKTKVIKSRGTEMTRIKPRFLWNLSENESCCRFRFILLSPSWYWVTSSAAEGDRYRIWPLVEAGFNDWDSCTGSSSSRLDNNRYILLRRPENLTIAVVLCRRCCDDSNRLAEYFYL